METTSEGPEAKEARGRSTIAFPYFALEDAVTVATAVHSQYGGRCDLDQLAAAIGQKPTSGGFRLKVSASRIFGLITSAGQTVSVTDLGSHAVSEKPARTTAFLNVPLYQALFDRFRGRTLPNDKGLEAAIRDLGVSEKQIVTARQVFQRSADYAGFFAHGRDKLVMPPAGTINNAESRGAEPTRDRAFVDDNGTPEVRMHPLIVGMLGALPKPGEEFPEDDRELWLEAAKVNLQLIYGKPKNRRNGDAQEPQAATGDLGAVLRGTERLA